MDLPLMLSLLEGEDNVRAFAVLRELENLSDESDALYPWLERFAQMVQNRSYAVRVRGFRLFCKQAQWDVGGRMDGLMEDTLSILTDEKPTAVRQALAALQDVARYKKGLHEVIRRHVEAIDVYRYQDTMHSLLQKDIHDLLAQMPN